jgi:esterase
VATIELHARTIGDGRPLVFLHGLLGSGRNWQSVAQALTGDGWRGILVDARNHGASPWADDTSYPSMADDVAALLDRQGLGPITLLGHSMGGKTALTLALTAPERIERLVLVDIAPVAYPGDFSPYIDAMAALDLGTLAKRADADAALAPAVPDPGVRGFLLQNLVPDGGGWRWRVNLAALRRAMPQLTGFPDELRGRTYAGPSALIRGERSSYVPQEHEPALRAYLPDVTIHTVEDAGHWPHAERPQDFLAALREALR